ncbi:MAG: FG-GAP-like repeat-containing protein [Janthinobacterium lividum]
MPNQLWLWGKCLLLLLLLLVAARQASAQGGPASYFRPDAGTSQRAAASPLAQQLRQYQAYTLDLAGLRTALAGAKLRSAGLPLSISLPQPDGRFQRFAVWKAPLLAPALAAQYPDVHTYGGRGIDDPTAVLSLTVSSTGLLAQVLSERPSGTMYLDAASQGDALHYLSYYAHDVLPTTGSPSSCGSTPLPAVPQPSHGPHATGARNQAIAQPVGPVLNVYRLVVTTTKEYTNGRTDAAVMTEVAGLINNVRTIQERDLAVSMTLVGTHFYNTTTTGNYNQADDAQMINQNRINVDNEFKGIGYDIGHLFATSGTGLAYVGVVANSATGSAYSASTVPTTGPNIPYKAGAVSGNLNRTSPASYYATNIISHEMGHQFSATHTFNVNAGGCGGTARSSNSAWEPGQGSTIMSYGDGGCGSNANIQAQTDPYYHAGSIDQMRTYIESISYTATPAGTQYSSGNTAPTVAVPAAKTIPQGTPFKLTATGADANGDALYYNWDELDLGSAADFTTPQATNDNVPLFRSIPPSTTNATRYFPRLSYLSGSPSASTNATERLPTVARSLNFKCTARDYHVTTNTAAYNATTSGIVGGVTESALVTLTVSAANSQPFAVTAPNTAVKWAAGSTQTVTWNGVGTKSSAVSCQTVDIRLSTDSGLTYPTLLASGVANADGTGTASITVPAALNTTTARVMVEAADNYFFDISDTDFTITTGPIAASLSPTSGPVGTTVTITGDNFGTSAADLTVTFAGGVTGTITGTVTNTSFQVTVPNMALTGVVTVTRTGTGTSSPGSFTVTPVVSSTNPTSGAEGSTVTIYGSGLRGATQVSFNGAIVKAANFTSTDFTTQTNTITLNVPTGATTGPVVVTTTGGNSNTTVSFAVTTFTASTLLISPAMGAPTADERSNITASLNGTATASNTTTAPIKVSSLQAGGRRAGTTTISGKTISFDPTTDFRAGETVQVTVTTAATTTNPLTSTPTNLARSYVSQYTTRTRTTSGLGTSVDYTAGVGTQPDYVVAGNLDADAALDLVVVNNGSSTVSVLLNNGSGTGFTAATGSPITVGSTPQHAILADLNNDGNLDLLVTCSGTVNVLKGNGDGTFTAQTSLTIASAMMSAVGDLNGDGNLDLLTVRYTSPGIAVINLGNGNFGFTSSSYNGLNVGPRSVVLADFNEDGRLDLATADYANTSNTGTVSVRLGDGAGSFAASGSAGSINFTSVSAASLVAADLTGDGHLDLAVNSPGYDSRAVQLQVYTGGGDGTFDPAVTLTPTVFGYTLSTGDYNGDGIIDLILPLSGYSPAGVDIFSYVVGSSYRTAAAFGRTSKSPIGAFPRYVALADINNDQALDFITANSVGANSVSTALGTASGAPLPVELLAFAATRRSAEAVQLSWRTASELHNAGFVVERSLDGRTFTDVSALLPGLGNSLVGRSYAHLDQPAPGSQLYYRLRQIDEDGAQRYSPVAVVAAATDAPALLLYPNPATAAVTVQLSGSASAAPVLVLNALGQVVQSRPALAAGQALELPLTGLAPGLYVVRCGALMQRLTVE